MFLRQIELLLLFVSRQRVSFISLTVLLEEVPTSVACARCELALICEDKHI